MGFQQLLEGGDLGCQLQLPEGDACCLDDSSQFSLTIQDGRQALRWTMRFFDNLHMDLSPFSRPHLNKSIERHCRSTFPEQSPTSSKASPQTPQSDNDDTDWSPIVDLGYIEVSSHDGVPTPGLLLIHRTVCSHTEQVVKGRFFLPVQRGLFEVLVVASEKSVGVQKPTREQDMYKESLRRVQRAMTWLVYGSHLVVTEPPLHRDPSGKEVFLRQLHCRFVPPPRFIFCPNAEAPESNKHRFCRASFGGTTGVQVMVVSCWYGHNIRRGATALRQVAVHGAGSIHESQQFQDIRISVEDVSLNRTWLGIRNKDVVITVVDCVEAGGVRRQNTIGWIREPSSGTIYLLYFVDTLGLDEDEVRAELVESLSSLRAHGSPRRRRSARELWNTKQLITNESSAQRCFTRC